MFSLFGLNTATFSKIQIKGIVKRKYPSYQIVRLRVERLNPLYSSIEEAEGAEIATSARAVIKNEEERRTLSFEKIFGFWKMEYDAPDYGPNVPEGEYYKSYHFGLLNIYRTKNGRVYELSKKDFSWKSNEQMYSIVSQDPGYTQISENEAQALICELKKS